MARLFFSRFWSLWLLVAAALVNVISLLYITFKTCDVPESVSYSIANHKIDNVDSGVDATHDPSSFTFVLREFEDFSNDITNTTLKLSNVFRKSTILVIADNHVYPPLRLADSQNIRLINLHGSVDKPFLSSQPNSFIKSQYVIFIPDAVQVSDRFRLIEAEKFFLACQRVNPRVTMAVWPLNRSTTKCVNLDVDLKKWTVSQELMPNNSTCDAIVGSQFVLLLTTKTLLELPYPFQRPFDPTMFIQNSVQGHQVAVDWHSTFFYRSHSLFENDPHKSWKHEKNERIRLREAFSRIGVKRFRHATGTDEWFGCGKDTSRCFGTVVNDMPEFIYQNRWTPPCCLRALQMTVHHVFKILSDQGVRFWLEGGSLLGAIRNGDIIPWDYDVDIGIYRDDIVKSSHLLSCHSEVFEDEKGFVWETAAEGEFFRVQYSRTNHLHVDIFPFYSVNGTMTKNTWFKTHRQDREFPESFLRPLETISFVGIQAPIPNNARKFLEFKFGDGVIENPRYPNAQSVQR